MKRRILLIIGGIAGVVLIWILVAGSRGRGPAPGLSTLLRSGQSQTPVTTAIEHQPIDLPNTMVPVSAQPISPLQYLPRSRRFLAYGLNDQTIYTVDAAGVSQGIYQHASGADLAYAELGPDESHLIVVTTDGTAQTVVVRLTDGLTSEAPPDSFGATWLPSGNLAYARLSGEKASLFTTSGPDFTHPTEVARVPAAYDQGSLLVSPDGKLIVWLSPSSPFDSGLAAQIIALNERTITKVGDDITAATWSPDSRYLFGISSADLTNFDDPVMLAWQVSTKKTSTITGARWFPRSLFPMPGKGDIYWTLQSALDDQTNTETWGTTVVDVSKMQMRAVNLLPTVRGSIGLFGLTENALLGLGSDTAYQTPLKPVLDAAQKILP